MKRFKLKGMTLMEVIIAMVVMVICASILVIGATAVVNNTRTARHVITKVDEQAPDVENHPAAITAYETGAALNISFNGAAGNAIPIDKFEAPTTQVSSDQACGNLKYFEPVPVTAATTS